VDLCVPPYGLARLQIGAAFYLHSCELPMRAAEKRYPHRKTCRPEGSGLALGRGMRTKDFFVN
jgi:hypothetical protein